MIFVSLEFSKLIYIYSFFAGVIFLLNSNYNPGFGCQKSLMIMFELGMGDSMDDLKPVWETWFILLKSHHLCRRLHQFHIVFRKKET